MELVYLFSKCLATFAGLTLVYLLATARPDDGSRDH